MATSSTIKLITGLALTLGAVSCDRRNDAIFDNVQNDHPTTIDIGPMQVLTSDQLDALREAQAAGESVHDWCKEVDDLGRPRCFFGQVSSTYGEYRGGATFTFTGTGDEICIVSDPESVFWNHNVGQPTGDDENEDGRIDPNELYTDFENRYQDNLTDDGDMDLYAGLSSYYTGSPGVEIGDFKGFYTDSQGRQIEIEYGLCLRRGSSIADSSFNTAQAGRGAPEWCEFSTEEREGIDYTVVLEAFTVPMDDGALAFSAMVVEGSCSPVQDECAILSEALPVDESDGIRACSDRMQLAYCQTKMTTFCCLNPEMCGDAPEDDFICSRVESKADEICADDETSSLCCPE
jgi:hypothetical protein